jgi:hypothetical protein
MASVCKGQKKSVEYAKKGFCLLLEREGTGFILNSLFVAKSDGIVIVLRQNAGGLVRLQMELEGT